MFAAISHVARITGQAALAAVAVVVVLTICAVALLFTLVCAPPLERLRRYLRPTLM
jgi:hypothetical protein